MAGKQPADVMILVVPCEAALESTPTIADLPLLACPDGVNMGMELLSVGIVQRTVVADAGGVTVDLEFTDDSDSDSDTDLKATFALTGLTAKVYNEIWRGCQAMDPGDVINLEFTTDGGLTTPAVGAAIIVEYRVTRRSGD